jgi:transcription elongation factor Elf1
MHVKYLAPSHLPIFLLPCPHCGHHLDVATTAPAKLPGGINSNDLQEVTHVCAQCGATFSGMVRLSSDDTDEIARQA